MFKLPPIAVILCLNISLVLLCCVEYPLAHGSIRFLDQMPQQIGEGQRMPCRKCIDLRLLLIGKMWGEPHPLDRKSTRLNSSHQIISYAVFCLKKKNYKT